MTLEEYVEEHRGELDKYIREAIGRPNFDLDDNEREDWVLNDEYLYNMALRAGVEGI